VSFEKISTALKFCLV